METKAKRTLVKSAPELWELADTGHTAGLRTHPAEYERRTTSFLDRALGLKETP